MTERGQQPIRAQLTTKTMLRRMLRQGSLVGFASPLFCLFFYFLVVCLNFVSFSRKYHTRLMFFVFLPKPEILLYLKQSWHEPLLVTTCRTRQLPEPAPAEIDELVNMAEHTRQQSTTQLQIPHLAVSYRDITVSRANDHDNRTQNTMKEKTTYICRRSRS